MDFETIEKILKIIRGENKNINVKFILYSHGHGRIIRGYIGHEKTIVGWFPGKMEEKVIEYMRKNHENANYTIAS